MLNSVACFVGGVIASGCELEAADTVAEFALSGPSTDEAPNEMALVLAEMGEPEQPIVHRAAPDYRSRKLIHGEPGYLAAGGGCSDGICTDQASPAYLVRQGDKDGADSALAGWNRGAPDPDEAREKRRAGLAESSERALDDASELCDADKSGVFMVYLENPYFDFTRARDIRMLPRGEERRALMQGLRAEREAQLAPGYADFAKLLGEAGGMVRGEMLTTAALSVELPGCQAFDLAQAPSVLGIQRVEGNTVSLSTGTERRAAMGIVPDGEPGLDGQNGGSMGSANKIRYGVIEGESEGNKINKGHRSFFENGLTNPQFNRVIDTDTCKFRFGSGIKCWFSSITTVATHGTTVTSLLLGDLLDLQDPAFPGAGNQIARQARTAIMQEAEVRYYNAAPTEALSTAISEACFNDGVDIINLSGAISPLNAGNVCSNAEEAGVRAVVEAASNAGILLVAAAGDDPAQAFSCSVSRLATFPHTLAVGATNPVTTLAALDSVAIAPFSGKGEFGVSLHGGGSTVGTPVDLVTNGVEINYSAASGSSGPSSYLETLGIGVSGTSFSTPIVASVGGMVYDWIADRGGLGGLEVFTYAIRSLLAVMGDGRAKTHPYGWGWAVDKWFGFGNLRWVNLDTELGGSWQWATHGFTLNNGVMVEWPIGPVGPESASVNGWKFAAYLDVDFYGSSPHMVYELIDKCPSGGGEALIRKSDGRHALKGRMRMRGWEMASKFHGKCLWMRVTVQSSSGPFNFFATDYFYSNARENHDVY